MLSPGTCTAFQIPSCFSSSRWVNPSSSSSSVFPAAASSPLAPSFNALYLRPVPTPLQQQQQHPQIQQHTARGRPLAFWQRQVEEEVVDVEEEEEMSDDEKEAIRLQKILDKRLVLAAQALAEDWPVYLFLIGIQAIPVLAGGLVGGNFLFFWLTACTCVYLGAKRSSAVARAGEIFQAVTTRNAFAAPIAASVSLFGTYYLLKNQFDIATVYQLMTTFFGGYCLRDVLISTLLFLGLGNTIDSFLAPPPPPLTSPPTTRRSLFFPPTNAATAAPPSPPSPSPSSSFPLLRDPEEGELNNIKWVATALSGAVCATYLWGPAAAVAAAGATGAAGAGSVAFVGAISALLAANFITSGIALQAQASIPIKSLKPALIFLTGLFLYDIYFVFLSPGGVMESVATSLEGPVKLLSPRAAAATAPGQYPFSILGLGDIVVPGLFVGLLKRIDEGVDGLGEKNTFFAAGMTGYGVGLLLTFLANILMHRGQPALLYIVPSLIAAALGTAAVTGRWEEVWGFNGEEAEEGMEGA